MKLSCLICLFITLSCFSQNDSLTRHVIGLRFSGYYLNTTEDFQGAGKSNTFEFRVEPYYMYTLNPYIRIGILGEYHTGGSSLSQIIVPKDLYGLGFISRVTYLNLFNKTTIHDRFVFFSELSFSTTNFYLSKQNTFTVQQRLNFDYSLLRLRFIGIGIRIYEGLSADLSGMLYKFFPGKLGFLPNIGLFYTL
jgi:hypothetical protein